MVTALGILISGFALTAVLLNAVPLYLLNRLPTDNEEDASICAVVLMFICLVLLFVVLL
jgi:hypothetical protein